MKPVKAVYKIPYRNLAFLVIDSPESMQPKLPGNKKTMECFEHILQWRYHEVPRKDLPYRTKRVHECDFLQSISRCMPTARECTNHMIDSQICMELLAVNRGSCDDFDPTFFTPKLLDIVSVDDIIEVFI